MLCLKEKIVFKVTLRFGSGLDDWRKEVPFPGMLVRLMGRREKHRVGRACWT